MNKILVLGSDYGTIQVVKEAHKMGLYVIVTDTMTNSPTKEEADEAWMVSTTDLDVLETKCRDNNINAVMFGASDFNIDNARKLAKRLGLPIYCDNDSVWSIVRDKSAFKEICKKIGARIATDYYLTDELTGEQLDKVRYPVVVKPSDKSGNRGMSYCSNREELVVGYKKARSISTHERIIVERQLQGEEFNVHYLLADGEAHLLYFSATHHQPGEEKNLYSFKYTTSKYLKQYLEEVDEKAVAVIKEIGCKEGIVWFDIMRDADGHFYMLEMGYRFGGVMTYVPYEKVSGINTVKWMLECALGVKHTVSSLPPALNKAYPGCAASYHLFAQRGGEIAVFDGLEEIEKIPDVWVDCPKRTGNVIRYKANSGLIGIYGIDVDDLCNKVRRINDLLHVKNSMDQEMIIHYDDFDTLRDEYNSGLREFSM